MLKGKKVVVFFCYILFWLFFCFFLFTGVESWHDHFVLSVHRNVTTLWPINVNQIRPNIYHDEKNKHKKTFLPNTENILFPCSRYNYRGMKCISQAYLTFKLDYQFACNVQTLLKCYLCNWKHILRKKRSSLQLKFKYKIKIHVNLFYWC